MIPGEFKSSKDGEAIKCSVKASDGYLYPLKSSLVFIHKPVHYIKLSEIKYVEFSRVGGGVGLPSSRSFDMTVTKLKDEAPVTFAGIDRQEHKNLMNYLKAKNIKMRSVDVDTNREINISESEEAEESDSGAKKGGAAGKKGKAPQMDDYDEEDSEDDESFKDEGSEQGSEGEEGEQEEDDDESGSASGSGDEEMDEDIDKDELKALQKEAASLEIGSTRRTRGGARTAT